MRFEDEIHRQRVAIFDRLKGLSNFVALHLLSERLRVQFSVPGPSV